MIAFATQSPSPCRDRRRNVALWMVQVVLAVQFALAGAGRVAGRYQDLADRVNRLVADLWLRSADGSLEPGGTIGLVVPGLFAVVTLGLAALVVVASVVHLVGLLAWAHGPLARR